MEKINITVKTDELIVNKIYIIRGQKVMLDKDLAEMFDTSTKAFNQSVKRNIERFPEDFMFELTEEEWVNLRSQFVTSSWGGTRYLPKAFTEHGVAMLSGILNSKTAIEVHIKIVRVFSKMRELMLTHKDILLKLEQIEKQTTANSSDIQTIFKALKQLLNPPKEERVKIGYKIGKDKN